MIETRGNALFLKTFFQTDVEHWGVLALARQSAEKALSRYRLGDLVLLAQSGRALGENGPGRRGGRVFAVCTLTGQQGKTCNLANPEALAEWAEELERHNWRECVVIDKYWRMRTPRHFVEFSSRGLFNRSGHLRGKLGTLDRDTELDAELREWLATVEFRESDTAC